MWTFELIPTIWLKTVVYANICDMLANTGNMREFSQLSNILMKDFMKSERNIIYSSPKEIWNCFFKYLHLYIEYLVGKVPSEWYHCIWSFDPDLLWCLYFWVTRVTRVTYCYGLASVMHRPLTSSSQELLGQSWPNLLCSTFRVRKQEIVNFMTPHPQGEVILG